LSSALTQPNVLQKTIVYKIGRDLSEQMARYHGAIAERLGLSVADHKALDLVCTAGPMTAGQLAELTNLTTGAVTGLVDRLEQAGVVRRERDPQDRRRVIIQSSSDVLSLMAIFESLTRALGEVCSEYTDQELTTILDFVERTVAILQAQTSKLQKNDANA